MLTLIRAIQRHVVYLRIYVRKFPTCITTQIYGTGPNMGKVIQPFELLPDKRVWSIFHVEIHTIPTLILDGANSVFERSTETFAMVI